MVPTWRAATTTQITANSSQSFCQRALNAKRAGAAKARLYGVMRRTFSSSEAARCDSSCARARGVDLALLQQRRRGDVRREALLRVGQAVEQVVERLQRARQVGMARLDAAL